MLAAASASEEGARVTLLERGPKLGRKLRLTGKGRCNITNTAGTERFVQAFGPNGKFLYGPLARFSRDDLITLLDAMGVRTKIERGGRVFPESDSALEVAAALERMLADRKVDVRFNARVKTLTLTDAGDVAGVALYHGTMDAGAVVIATGGLSYPGTGSTGDGYALAQAIGHTIVPTHAALAPVVVEEAWVRDLSGLTLKNVNVRLLTGKPPTETASRFGEMLFTHTGLSGPIILTISRYVPVDPRTVPSIIELDLKPALTDEALHARLIRDFAHRGSLGAYLRRLVPRSLADVLVSVLKLDACRGLHQVTAEERRRIVDGLKRLRFRVRSLAPIEEAIVTAGGVALNEVDPRTMMSRRVGGVFFAGEVLDLDAETGGFNLQAAFSTGWVAGQSAARWLSLPKPTKDSPTMQKETLIAETT
jgi:predicted Rossmann fold flavoprotein